MKILFINAISRREIDFNDSAIFESLGPAYLASSLRQNIDASIEFKIINDNIEEELAAFKPDIVGISSVTQNYNIAKKYAEIVKRKGLLVIVGGIHISLLPETLDKNMDVGVVGEGEETVVDVVKLIKEGKLCPDELSKVDGVVYWDGGTIKQTPRRKLIEPLDKIPLPARDLLHISKFAHMFSSRGCPYRCSFCSSSRFWEKTRFFSAEYVVKEIEELIEKYGVEKITFHDDLFIADKKRLKELADLIVEKGIDKKISFWVQLRANLVDEETVKDLKRMNSANASLGLESGCPRTLEFLKGKSVTVEDNRNAVRLLKKYGFNVFAFFIIGAPYETREDILETLQFVKESDIDTCRVFVLTPLPSTPVWDYALKRGFVSNDMDWSRLDVNFDDNHEKAIILSEKLTGDEIYKLYLLFDKERRRRARRNLIHSGLTKPQKIPRYLMHKIRKTIHSLIKRPNPLEVK